MLRQMDELSGDLTVYTGRKALRVTGEGAVCEDNSGNEALISGKSVICALGQHSRTGVAEEPQDAAAFVRVIGGAKVSAITNAVCRGYHAALDI